MMVRADAAAQGGEDAQIGNTHMNVVHRTTVDTERFRLRNFIKKLTELGECEVRNDPIDLIDVGAALDGNPRAVHFKAAGPEKAELVGNVMGSRKRLGLALDTDERGGLGRAQPAARQIAAAGQNPVAASPRAASGLAGRRRRPHRAPGAPAARRATARPIFPPVSTTRCFPAPVSPMSAAAASCCAVGVRPGSI